MIAEAGHYALVLNAMRDSIVFFSTPSMAAEKQIPTGKRFRLGGLVQPGSLVRGDNLAVNFSVADGAATLPVAYKGILPDLFREGQGVVAHGKLGADGVFVADEVLAKHDEKYMPPEVAKSLKNKEAAYVPQGKGETSSPAPTAEAPAKSPAGI